MKSTLGDPLPMPTKYHRSAPSRKPTGANSLPLRSGFLGEQPLESRLVDHWYAQLAGAVELRAGLFAGQHVVGALADGGGEGAPGGREPLDELAARAAQGAGYDHLLARERAVGGPGARPLEVDADPHEALDQVPVVFEGEVLRYRPRDDPADAFDLDELLRGNSAQEVLAAEALGYELRRHRPDVPDAEREHDAGEGLLLAPLDPLHQVLRALLSEALEGGDLIGPEIVDVRGVPYEAEVEEAGGYLLPETLYVHRALGGPVDDVLERLRWAAGVDAARDRLALGPRDRLPADRAMRGHPERVIVAVAVLGDGADDLRDHVPSPLDDDGVADEDALLLQVVLVVQRGARDRHPADVHRLQDGLRRQRPGPADVDDDVVELRAARERLGLVR